VLPYAARLGRAVPAWTFAVDGVTSISVDTHKYAYAPKGTSLLLHRDAALRKPQFFASAAWPGYTMLNATTQSTRSGGPIAGTWAVVEHIGDEGYAELTDKAFAAVDAIVACIEWEPALRLVVAPDSTLVTLATDESLDPFTLTDELVARGWYVQPQLSYADSGPSIHLSVSAGTLAHVEADDHTVVDRLGESLRYDKLLIAVGAIARPALEGAISFGGPADVAAVERAVETSARIAFVIPSASAWKLTSTRCRNTGSATLRMSSGEGTARPSSTAAAFAPRIRA